MIVEYMPRWRVDYIGKGGKHLGTVEAPDEKAAVAEAAKQFQHPAGATFSQRFLKSASHCSCAAILSILRASSVKSRA